VETRPQPVKDVLIEAITNSIKEKEQEPDKPTNSGKICEGCQTPVTK
jgi:hypothetical protein